MISRNRRVETNSNDVQESLFGETYSTIPPPLPPRNTRHRTPLISNSNNLTPPLPPRRSDHSSLPRPQTYRSPPPLPPRSIQNRVFNCRGQNNTSIDSSYVQMSRNNQSELSDLNSYNFGEINNDEPTHVIIGPLTSTTQIRSNNRNQLHPRINNEQSTHEVIRPPSSRAEMRSNSTPRSQSRVNIDEPTHVVIGPLSSRAQMRSNSRPQLHSRVNNVSPLTPERREFLTQFLDNNISSNTVSTTQSQFSNLEQSRARARMNNYS